MLLLKPLSLAICTALAASTAAQSDDDTPNTLHFFDENFEIRHAKADTDDFSSSSFAGMRMPRKCIDLITEGKSFLTRECYEWIKANPDFEIPTPEPTTMAPTPFFHISSSLKETSDKTVTEVKLKPTDDTFIEVWRPDEPLGDRTKLKIDAMEGIPTKVIMLKFALGHVLREYHEGDTRGMNATLTSAKLRLFAITDTHFGGYVSEMESDWNEETAVWDNYVKKDKRGSYEKDAENLLPDGKSDVIGKIGNVTQGNWYEADLTQRLVDIFDGDQDGVSGTLSLRMTTDSADGVIYASKEYEGLSPELILDFTFTGGEKEEVLDQNTIELTGSPTATPQEDMTDSIHPTSHPSSSPAAAVTPIPTSSPDAVVVDSNLVADETDAPISSPSQVPTTKEPTKAPIVTEKEVASFEDSTTSVVSSSFKMTITAIEELFRLRNLRGENRDLSVFMSVNEKERPALKRHLLHVSKIILDNAPEDIMLSFEDDVIVEIIEKSNKDNGGVIRTSTFRVVGEFNEADVKGTTAAQLAALLDQTITYAFVGFQKKSFLEILSNTGRAIYSKTASQDVSVTKVNYSTASDHDSLAFANDNGKEMVSQTEDASESGAWIQPTLIAGAAMLFVATASASLLVFRLKNNSQQSHEIQGKSTSDESPRSLEETVAPSTPSPTIFADRWKKKKFDYAEFQDDPDAEDAACAMSPMAIPTTSKYFDKPARDIKFSHYMNSSFEDSSISDVSQGHMLGAKGSMQVNGPAKEDSSQAESFLLDTTMDSYNMDTMSELNARLENVLQLDGASPRENANHRTDEASHMTVNSSVPSELYSDVNSTDSPREYDRYDTEAAYASHLITLDMIKNNDMPPPPSDVASDSSSYQDDKLADVDQNLHFYSVGGAEERLIQHAKSYQVEDAVCPKTKTEMINDELSKVMKLLQTPSKDGGDAECYGSPESTAEIYIQSESDTESASMSSLSVIGGLAKGSNQRIIQTSGDDKSVSSTEALNNTVYSSQDREAAAVNVQSDGTNVHVNSDSNDENEENDPLQAMNVALNECIQILDKAAAGQ